MSDPDTTALVTAIGQLGGAGLLLYAGFAAASKIAEAVKALAGRRSEAKDAPALPAPADTAARAVEAQAQALADIKAALTPEALRRVIHDADRDPQSPIYKAITAATAAQVQAAEAHASAEAVRTEIRTVSATLESATATLREGVEVLQTVELEQSEHHRT